MMGIRLAVRFALLFCRLLLSASKNTNGTHGAVVLWECHHNFSDPSEAKSSTIYWQGISPSDVVLHLYKEGQEKLEHQTESFKNTTKIFLDQIPFGNLSLAIRFDLKHDKIQAEVVIWSEKGQRQRICQTTLNVAARFQKPTIEVNQNDMTVTCNTTGGFPRPEVKWTSSDRESGKERTLEEMHYNTTKENGLFNITTTANATGAKEVMCSFFNPTSNETVFERKVIPAPGQRGRDERKEGEEKVQDQEEPGNHNVLIGVVVGVGVLLLLVLLGLAVYCIKCHRQRRQQRPVQECVAELQNLAPPQND